MTQHHDHRQHPDWERTTKKQGNRYLQWNSLLEETTIDGLTVTPLTDEPSLFREAMAMGHAVHIWGEICARGYSRIFAIAHDGQPKATMEIRPKDDQWTVHQVVGPRFTKPSQDCLDAANQVAELYNQAWAKNPDHQHWTLPAD